MAAAIASLSAGLLGLGGGLVLAPLLLAGSPFRPGPLLDIPTIAAITIVQDLCGCFFASAARWREYRDIPVAVLPMVGAAFAAALVGGGLSALVSPSLLRAAIMGLTTLAVALLVLPPQFATRFPEGRAGRRGQFAVAAIVGLAGGLIGQAAGFLLIPMMLVVLDVPLTTAATSSLPIALSSAVGGLLGRFSFQPVPWQAAVLVLLIAIPITIAGTRLRSRVSVNALRWILAVIVGLTAGHVWFRILGGG